MVFSPGYSLDGACIVHVVDGILRVLEEEEGELRPLLVKTDRESVLRGEDYWIDYNEVTFSFIWCT